MQSIEIEDTNLDSTGTGTVVEVKFSTTNGKTKDALPITTGQFPQVQV